MSAVKSVARGGARKNLVCSNSVLCFGAYVVLLRKLLHNLMDVPGRRKTSSDNKKAPSH